MSAKPPLPIGKFLAVMWLSFIGSSLVFALLPAVVWAIIDDPWSIVSQIAIYAVIVPTCFALQMVLKP